MRQKRQYNINIIRQQYHTLETKRRFVTTCNGPTIDFSKIVICVSSQQQLYNSSYRPIDLLVKFGLREN